jgi:hypothetical protein
MRPARDSAGEAPLCKHPWLFLQLGMAPLFQGSVLAGTGHSQIRIRPFYHCVRNLPALTYTGFAKLILNAEILECRYLRRSVRSADLPSRISDDRIDHGSIAVVYFFSWVAQFALSWIDGHLADIGNIAPLSPQIRLFISLVGGMAAGFLFIFARISVVQRVRIQITQEFRRSVEDHIKYYDELYSILLDQTIENEIALRLISEKSRNHSIFLCSRLAEIFELQTYGPCHATIKTFNPEDQSVTTRTRDALSHNIDRTLVDEHLQSYDYRDNTAFQVIIDDPTKDFYVNNYLGVSSVLGKYKNANKNWKKHYRATVVMPICSKKSPAHITVSSVVGFVCVDNMCGNFSRRYSRAVLGVFVALITDMMIKLGELESPTIAAGGDDG